MPTAWRTVRVFVSSTFRDMQAEREELVKRVFPQLRKLCEERFVTWGEVDLRWGIPGEEKAEGKVLPICLAEIERCRPYFIGLLGERYGWVPEEIPPELIEQEPWLAEHLHHSVTELEILHGVLQNPEMAEHAFFYLRDPVYVGTLPPETQPEFIEESPEGAQKLRELKDRIRASSFPVREGYPNPQALGRLVLEDLTRIINDLYPEGTEPAPLDREAAEHEAFAQSRARVYIGRQECFDRLDEHAAGDGPPLVVLGESGSGKSALLANWALRYRDQHPDELVIMHFIGASPYSADWAAMVRRIMGELKRRFGIQGDIPDKPDELRLAFANWLHMAAVRGRVVLTLDALNQLEDREGAPDLVWLPPVIPNSVRLLLSTLPGRPLDDLRKRGWPALAVQSLSVAERTLLIAQYLAQYAKALSMPLAERIAASDQAASPLFLTALLEELRLFGKHERLVERIEHYLAAPTPQELYERILARWEEDYERDRPGLVRDAMTAIWAARRGLSEVELLELLGTDGEPLPRARWSLLYLAAEQALVSRAGLIGFFHDYLREAAQKRYLPDEPARHAAHLRLADYFAAQELGPRQVDELPWHLAEGKAWQRLYDLLGDLRFFDAAWTLNSHQVMASWASVEGAGGLSAMDAYSHLLREPRRFPFDSVWTVASFLGDTANASDADLREVQQYMVEQLRQGGSRANLMAALGNLGKCLSNLGRLDDAMALFKEQEGICRELGDRDFLQHSLSLQANIHLRRGELDAALTLVDEEEALARELGSERGLAESIADRVDILIGRGHLRAAKALLEEHERMCRAMGDGVSLLHSLRQQVWLASWGAVDRSTAIRQCQEAVEIAQALGQWDHLAMARWQFRWLRLGLTVRVLSYYFIGWFAVYFLRAGIWAHQHSWAKCCNDVALAAGHAGGGWLTTHPGLGLRVSRSWGLRWRRVIRWQRVVRRYVRTLRRRGNTPQHRTGA